jgi:hypothetical protein
VANQRETEGFFPIKQRQVFHTRWSSRMPQCASFAGAKTASFGLKNMASWRSLLPEAACAFESHLTEPDTKIRCGYSSTFLRIEDIPHTGANSAGRQWTKED